MAQRHAGRYRSRPSPHLLVPGEPMRHRARPNVPFRATFALALTLLTGTALPAAALADNYAPPPHPADAALLARMTLTEKVNQLMLLSKGTMTGPDSAGRPNKSAEELAREGIGFQMSGFESAAEVN